MRFSFLSLALACTLTPAAAFAADGDSTTADTASGKHVAITGGFIASDAGPAPAISLSYLFNDNWSVELWGTADKIEQHDRIKHGPKIGTYEHQPVSLSAQYHFGNVDNSFRPFVGLGYFHSDKLRLIDGAPALEGTNLGRMNGAALALGVDMNIDSTWFARADVRALGSNSKIKTTDAALPSRQDGMLMAGFSIGARF